MAYNYQTALFIETNHFTRQILKYLSDEEYRELQYYLMEHPDIGVLISGGGGIHKVRWSRQGMGKSGGVRIIYYWAQRRSQLYMLTVYSKSEQEDVDAATLAQIAKQLETIK